MRSRGGIAIVIAHRPSALASVDTGDGDGARANARCSGPRTRCLPRCCGVPAAAAPRCQVCGSCRNWRDRIVNASPCSIRFAGTSLRSSLPPCLLVVGLGGWAATTEFAGAVIAQGQVVVDSNVKKVQHPTGGIVGELRVRDGDPGQGWRHRGAARRHPDPRQPRHRRSRGWTSCWRARRARRRRRDGADTIEFPQDLLDRMDNPDVAKAVNGERKQFEIRRQAREGPERRSSRSGSRN